MSESTAAFPEDPVDAALRGPHRHLALGGDGPAVRYRADVSPFASLGPDPGPDAWSALAELPGEVVGLASIGPVIPGAGWEKLQEFPVLELTGEHAEAGTEDAEIELLTEADVPEMLQLIARTEPGPFLPGTIAFGGYVGIRRGGALVAMAGRRLRPPGWIEVSAVCTDPAQRSQGLGRRVTAAVVRGIRAEGERPFLHVLPTNPALGLYQAMGFVVIREARVTIVKRTTPDRRAALRRRAAAAPPPSPR